MEIVQQIQRNAKLLISYVCHPRLLTLVTDFHYFFFLNKTHFILESKRQIKILFLPNINKQKMDSKGRNVIVCDNGTGVRIYNCLLIFFCEMKEKCLLHNK